MRRREIERGFWVSVSRGSLKILRKSEGNVHPAGEIGRGEERGEGPPLGSAGGGDDVAVPAGRDADPTSGPPQAVAEGHVELEGHSKFQ